MARIRSFKPEVFTDAKTQKLSYPAFILWMAIWPQADDKTGCFDARPEILRGQIFPLRKQETDETVCGYLREMAQQKLVTLYFDGDQPLGQVSGWKHQKIDRPSKLVRFRVPGECPPPIQGVLVEPSTSTRGALTVGSGVGSGSGSGVGIGVGEKGANAPDSLFPKDNPEKEAEKQNVQKIWDHYLATWPRKAKLTDTRRDKIKARLKDSTLEEILLCITKSKRDDDWDKRPDNSDLELLLRSREKLEWFLRKPEKKAHSELMAPSWDEETP